MTLGKERRKYPRHETSWPVTVTTAKGSLSGEVKNISLGGALIRCKEITDLSGNLNLEIRIPDSLYGISLPARTVHYHVDESDNSTPSYSLGVSFIHVYGKNSALLRNAVSSLAMKKSQAKISLFFGERAGLRCCKIVNEEGATLGIIG
jgi:hypothetical protein